MNHFFKLARNESLKSTFRVKIGAVLVRKGTPISVGHNYGTKTHPETRKFHPYQTIHAELDCLIGLERPLINGCTMYVYREKANGEIACCKPCSTCQQILRNYGVKRVFYTTDNGKIEKLLLNKEI
jgi:deoxycytidylate deaminase